MTRSTAGAAVWLQIGIVMIVCNDALIYCTVHTLAVRFSCLVTPETAKHRTIQDSIQDLRMYTIIVELITIVARYGGLVPGTA